MKKQIAVLMAAATAVTTVAPAIANADVNTHSVSTSEVLSKMKNALSTRYDDKKQDGINASNADTPDAYLNSRYAVFIKPESALTAPQKDKYDVVEFEESKYKDVSFEIENNENVGAGWYVVKDAAKVAGLVESEAMSNNNLQVAVVDKGIKDGSSVQKFDQKHYVVGTDLKDGDNTVTLNKTATDLLEAATEGNVAGDAKKKDITFVKSLKATIAGETKYLVKDSKTENTVLIGADEEITKLELELSGGANHTLEANDLAFDISKPQNSKGGELDLANATQSVMDDVAKFDTIDNKDNKEVTVDIKNGDTELYKVSDVESTEIELGNIYTKKDGYTQKGEDFVNNIVKAYKDDKNGYKFNYGGTNYYLAPGGTIATSPKLAKSAIHFDEAQIDKSGDGYVLRLKVEVVDANDDERDRTLQFVISGDTQKDLATVLNDLKGGNTVVSGHFTKLVGSNRYETAVDVSAEQFDPETADSVVIVGGNALMDGLSAVPLATVKNAPILLSDANNGLSRSTLKEIDRACKSLKNRTVYVVGGEKSVPAKAVKQLEDEFGAVVVRVSGSDRYDTSLEVAKRLKYDKAINTDDLYVVGGEGAADAMSISGVAARIENKKVSPVLVVNKDGLKRSTRDFVKDNFETDKKYVIGGEVSVGTQVIRDLGSNTERVSGANRYATNVNIIKEFYSKGAVDDQVVDGKVDGKIVANGAIFTSGKNGYLVDAQTAGPIAANKGAAIVLTDNKLTTDQVDLLKNDGVLSKVKTNVYQVGGVVSSDVMEVVVDKLGL